MRMIMEVIVRDDVVVSIRLGSSNFGSQSILFNWITLLILQALQLIVEVDDVKSLLISESSILS